MQFFFVVGDKNCGDPRPTRGHTSGLSLYCIGTPIRHNWQVWKAPGYTPEMARIIRSAMLQTRVTPEIKYASEHVLHRLGLNMTEAIELFLRRMVIDQRLPFEVVAFDNATYAQLLLD